MARSDLLLSLALAALESDVEHARRAVESILSEEHRMGHSHVAQRLQQMLDAARPAQHVVSRPEGVLFASDRAQWTRARAPHRELDDVRLTPTALRTIEELVREQRHARALRAAGLEPRHRLLLVGPPGTGKTSLAEAIASELGLPLITPRYEALIGSYLGETSNRIGAVFETVAHAPNVLFLDEFETVAKERSDEHDTGELKRVASTLLLQLDSLPSHVVVIGATNHAELLDRAAWRRFQIVLEMQLPTGEDRRAFAQSVAHRVGASDPDALAADAEQMTSASYADIEEAVLAVRRCEVLAALEEPAS